jgi:hypothetical protein
MEYKWRWLDEMVHGSALSGYDSHRFLPRPAGRCSAESEGKWIATP